MMAQARSQIVDTDVTRYYHCISRCVRRAMLCGKGYEHRKQWIEDRLELLTDCFSISVGSFSVLDNHLHVVARLDPQVARDWSAEEVARRWLTVYPPGCAAVDDPKVLEALIAEMMQDQQRIEIYRKRLSSLSWFMKALKEPLARMANREDDCKGTFWEARFKSIAILGAKALLYTCLYVDLNPVAAGKSKTPAESKHTSIRQRVSHAKRKKALDNLAAANLGTVAGSKAAGNLEQDHWLIPIEDRRILNRQSREGMLETMSLGNYLILLDYVSRLCRTGKAKIDSSVNGILARIGAGSEAWVTRIKKMLNSTSLRGNYFTTDNERLKKLAKRKGAHRLINLSPQPNG